MPALTGLGALLSGITSEAQQVHAERYQQEQADREMAFRTLTYMASDPTIGNPNIKAEALKELWGRTLGTSLGDNYTHKPGKLGKLVDQFVGMQRPMGPTGQDMGMGAGPQAQQPGVGRGNATSQVGALGNPPQAPQAQGGAPQPQALGSIPPSPQANGLDLIPGVDVSNDGSVFSQSGLDKLAVGKKLLTDRVTAINDVQARVESWAWRNAKNAQGQPNDPELANMRTEDPQRYKFEYDRHMNPSNPLPLSLYKNTKGQDIPFEQAQQMAQQYGLEMPQGAQHGDNIMYYTDATGRPTRLEYGTPTRLQAVPGALDSTSPSGISTQLVRPDGSVAKSVPTMDRAGAEAQYLNKLAQDKGSPLTAVEIENAKAGLAGSVAGATEKARFPYLEQLAHDRGDIVGARGEVAKAFEPYKNALLLHDNMLDAYNRIHSGKSTAIGADDMILLSNHIAMTFGAVPGARSGTEIINAHRDAIAAFPKLQRQVNRVLAGDQLDEGQRKEFIKAAEDRLGEVKKAYDLTQKTWGYTPPGERSDNNTPKTGKTVSRASDAEIGDIYNGYRYKGGDKSAQTSWEAQ